MAEENGDDSALPFLTEVKSDHNAENPKPSWFSNCFPFLRKKRISPARSLDKIPLPTADQVDLERYYRIEPPQAKIYFLDLVVGTGEAVMMEKETNFFLQEVQYHYNHYTGSAKLVSSSNRSPLTYCFCHNPCRWLGRGVQGMKEGGIRRIVILPPQHKSTYNILSPGHKSAPPNNEVRDREIFDVQLVKVGISEFCKKRHIFPAGRNGDAERAKMFQNSRS